MGLARRVVISCGDLMISNGLKVVQLIMHEGLLWCGEEVVFIWKNHLMRELVYYRRGLEGWSRVTSHYSECV